MRCAGERVSILLRKGAVVVYSSPKDCEEELIWWLFLSGHAPSGRGMNSIDAWSVGRISVIDFLDGVRPFFGGRLGCFARRYVRRRVTKKVRANPTKNLPP